jgi:hypothetical protein
MRLRALSATWPGAPPDGRVSDHQDADQRHDERDGSGEVGRVDPATGFRLGSLGSLGRPLGPGRHEQATRAALPAIVHTVLLAAAIWNAARVSRSRGQCRDKQPGLTIRD